MQHAPAFRRLQGKTQLFPGYESDFFRNRLTHSLEVSQIAEAITCKLNYEFKQSGQSYKINNHVVRFASLAHDLGHPPFGHLGEEVLNAKMANFGGFEGNAQTLRIISKLEKKEQKASTNFPITHGVDNRLGLNLTYRTLASILKYDAIIPMVQGVDGDDKKITEKTRVAKPPKAYYECDRTLISAIKHHVAPGYQGYFKTVECAIMDIADDIAYSTYDLEDAFKAGFVTPLDILAGIESIESTIVKKVNSSLKKEHVSLGRVGTAKQITVQDVRDIIHEIFSAFVDVGGSDIKIAFIMSKLTARDGRLRTDFTSHMVGKLIREVNIIVDSTFPAMSKVYLSEDARIRVEVLKQFTWQYQILNNRLRVTAYRGVEIVSTIFDAIFDEEQNGPDLMPDDFKEIYEGFKEVGDKNMMARTVCDFVASMTDRYAIEFYGRLKSENPETIFKPF